MKNEELRIIRIFAANLRKRTMNKLSILLACAMFNPCFAQEHITGEGSNTNKNIMSAYSQAIDNLAKTRDQETQSAAYTADNVKLNPYFFRLMTPDTYYGSPMHQVLGISADDAESVAAERILAQAYVNNPMLLSRTEEVMKEEPALLEEIKAPVEVVETKLAEQAVAVDLDTDVPDTVVIIPKKPNFWKFTGNTSLQFTQSYFSDNWYQGGENNYAGIGMLTLEANYNNQQKIQWDNKLEAQLGFQTTNSDQYHKFRVTSNLLRLTSKLGYKAAKNWFYTGQLMTYTQLSPFYEKNQNTWKARFGTPWYLTLSVGMDYKYKSKNNKVELSVYISPIAYYMTYIDRRGIVDNPIHYSAMYGVMPENKGIYRSHSFHKFGPNLTVNSKIQIVKNVMWTSRLYWFSNFHSTLVEWENTFDFTINKYLSAKFYAYPRFDDSSLAYRRNRTTNRGRYLMFKEWLSLGISYSF